jgi:flagellar hook-basal body complex protein FliE
MTIPQTTGALGDVVSLRRTDPRHFGDDVSVTEAQGAEGSFGQLLLSALGNVNDSQLKGMELTQKMITDPESVDVHDVTLALTEATTALSMTKAIVDKALAAYREIINVR